eukprot:TRINITY_DN53069_c0_g2_i1.p1 TRINITY_DN53069_c0_g2~~TRINITY_DN53069_c0_g2_i1.p1  ORF type:complete len:237 (+),score=18.10 TRINITY_DN53069_c0_g2_i1:23-733(+)
MHPILPIYFIFSCVLAPIGLNIQDPDAIKQYLTDEWLLGSTGVLIVVLLFCTFTANKMPLTNAESAKAWWWLLNGVYIHGMMDGLAGACGKIPIMVSQYHKVDKRYSYGCTTEGGAPVCVLSLTELFLMAPLSVAIYAGYKWRSVWRRPLEIVVCVMQMTGTIFFVGAEVTTGLQNLPTDRNFDFTLDHIVYFWFAFIFCNLIWFLVPLRILATAFGDINAAVQKAFPPTPPGKKK